MDGVGRFFRICSALRVLLATSALSKMFPSTVAMLAWAIPRMYVSFLSRSALRAPPRDPGVFLPVDFGVGVANPLVT